MSKGWRYRVVKRVLADGDESFTIREFYPADKKAKHPDLWTGPITPESFGDDEDGPVESLRWQLEMMLRALDEPILEDKE